MSEVAPTRDLRATWWQAWFTLFAPILAVVLVRWLFIEPFVIPSGSMIPSLLIHDHILAEKWSYGVHWPGSDRMFWQWSHPKSGEVIVFRYPKNPEVFYVKRVVAVGGDEISVKAGILYRNGNRVEQESAPQGPSGIPEENEAFQYFREGGHWVRYLHREDSNFAAVKIPEGQLFVMGDNRDQSSDSRFWGFVPEDNVIGRVRRIWLACDETLPSANYLCNPQTLRWNRIGERVQ